MWTRDLLHTDFCVSKNRISHVKSFGSECGCRTNSFPPFKKKKIVYQPRLLKYLFSLKTSYILQTISCKFRDEFTMKDQKELWGRSFNKTIIKIKGLW